MANPVNFGSIGPGSNQPPRSAAPAPIPVSLQSAPPLTTRNVRPNEQTGFAATILHYYDQRITQNLTIAKTDYGCSVQSLNRFYRFNLNDAQKKIFFGHAGEIDSAEITSAFINPIYGTLVIYPQNIEKVEFSLLKHLLILQHSWATKLIDLCIPDDKNKIFDTGIRYILDYLIINDKPQDAIHRYSKLKAKSAILVLRKLLPERPIHFSFKEGTKIPPAEILNLFSPYTIDSEPAHPIAQPTEDIDLDELLNAICEDLPAPSLEEIVPVAPAAAIDPDNRQQQAIGRVGMLLYPLTKKVICLDIPPDSTIIHADTSNGHFTIHLNREQYNLIMGISTKIKEADFLQPIVISSTVPGLDSIPSSLFSLFYGPLPSVDTLLNNFKSPSRQFLFHATDFALQLFSKEAHWGCHARPEMVAGTTIFHQNLRKLTDAPLPAPLNGLKTLTRTIGGTEWHLIGVSDIKSFVHNAALNEQKWCQTTKTSNTGIIRLFNPFRSNHVTKWEQFYNRVRYAANWPDGLHVDYGTGDTCLSGVAVSGQPSFNLVLQGDPTELAPTPVLSVVPPQAAVVPATAAVPAPIVPPVQPASVAPLTIQSPVTNIYMMAKLLLYPLAEEVQDISLNATGMECTTTVGKFTIKLSRTQLNFLQGSKNTISAKDFLDPITIHSDKFQNPLTSSLLSIFYESNPTINDLRRSLKTPSQEFFSQATHFALQLFDEETSFGRYARRDILTRTNTFHQHLRKMTQDLLPAHLGNHQTAVRVIGETRWDLYNAPHLPTTLHNVALVEQQYCYAQSLIPQKLVLSNPFESSHIARWQQFYKRVHSVDNKPEGLYVLYNKRKVCLPGAAVAYCHEFNLILEGKSLDDAPPPAAAPAAIPIAEQMHVLNNLILRDPPPVVSAVPPPVARPNDTEIRIANVIETFWFQNPINYSRWIKLLIQSKGVFAFESLPEKLMEPLKKFDKAQVEAVLKRLGVGIALAGDLPDDIIDRTVPTLLRVKAAEFKLLKKEIGKAREIRDIEHKPCYLVKPGPRFVHVIKVQARFDEEGLISGFFTDSDNPESSISIDAFNRLVEEGRNKRAIVLQRETITLTEEEETPAAMPVRPKRPREETEEQVKVKYEREEDRSEPILPPVPQPRVGVKRERDSTVVPKAPKEGKFTDSADIKQTKKQALAKVRTGGIIPAPDMITPFSAPELTNALSLDDLYSALSVNAGAQVNHVVMGRLNALKAIFEEQPLVYEGLEEIRKLENTPLPTTPCLVPKAKKYQWELVLEAKRRENAGLGTILAPYMGLGKTWIYISKVILSIYEGAEGHHYIITPKPLRKTIYVDAVQILNNARQNAFFHLKSMAIGVWAADRLVNESDPAEVKFLLSILGCFEEDEFEKIMHKREPLINRLCTSYVTDQYHTNKLDRLYAYAGDLAPRERTPVGSFDKAGMDRILKFSSSRIRKCEEHRDLTTYAQDKRAHIIIGSYEHAEQFSKNVRSGAPASSLIFDEAQYIHNPEIKIAKGAETLLQQLNPKCKIAVTGTPIENGVEDLFQLVGLMAPKLKCASILSTLSTLLSSASAYVKSKQPDLALSHLIKFHGHLQAYLNRVSQNLVLILQKDDPRVKEAWGDGAMVDHIVNNVTLSDLARQKYEEAHALFKSRQVNPVTGKKLDSNMSYYARVASIMLDPELKADNLTAKDPAVRSLLVSIKNETDRSKIDELVARSAILSSILHSPYTSLAQSEDKVALIFVANIAVGKVVRKVLKKVFSKTPAFLMHGGQDDEKRDLIIDELKEIGKAKFGILSIESGSTGFSMPDAALTIMETLSYNPATELQAIGRMDRATSTGEKVVLRPRFGIFAEEHIPVIQDIKRLTFKNFFTPTETQLERLQDMVKLIRCNIYQSYLNEKRDPARAKKKMTKIDTLLTTLLDDIEEEAVQAFVDRLTPALPVPAPEPVRVAAVAKAALPPLVERYPGSRFFKMPLPSTLSNDDKIRLAAFISKHRQELEAPIKAIYNAFKDPALRPLVRSGSPMPTPESASAFRILTHFIHDSKQDIRSIDDIGIDLFRIEGQEYVLEDKQNPGRQKRIRLVKGTGNALEILI